MPRSLSARPTSAISGTAHNAPIATLPARRRSRSDSGRSSASRWITYPAASVSRIIPTRISPNSMPALLRSASATRSSVSALRVNAQAVTAAAASTEGISTASVRRRTGTIASQSPTPTTAAKMLPRNVLVLRMRDYANQYDLVVEGRDIGSVVFSDTPYKFYIDASPEVRAQRRAAQGHRDEIARRDQADSSRATSPLVIAKDAEVIDTSHLTVDEVVDEIVKRLRGKHLAV